MGFHLIEQGDILWLVTLKQTDVDGEWGSRGWEKKAQVPEYGGVWSQ